MTITPANPFSTRFTRPGAIQFVYPDGLSPQNILARFAGTNCHGEIAGPHGSGKSTLVHDLLPLLEQRFRFIEYIIIRSASIRDVDTHSSLSTKTEADGEASLMIIDGVERLSKIHRWALKRACQTREIGLLATVHRPNTWLSTIATIRPQKSIFVQIAERLQSESVAKVDADEMESAFENSNCDFREAFMSLYDRYEAARGSKSTEPSAHNH